MQKVFDTIKAKYIEELVLGRFDLDKEAIVEIDVLDIAIRAYLSQKGKDRKLHLIAYYSKQMKLVELNYDVYNKELLAIVNALKTWRVYL